MTADEIEAAIKGQRFAMALQPPGWILQLNDGVSVAWLCSDMTAYQYTFTNRRPKSWVVWLGRVPDDPTDFAAWGAIKWKRHSGPYRTRREAIAVALTARP